MIEPNLSRSHLALLVVLVAVPIASQAHASTWLTAGGGGTMSVIDNDSVRQMVGDSKGHLHGGGGLNAIVINDFVGAAYVNITRSERPPMMLGQPPIVIVSLSSKSITGVATDSLGLLQGERRSQSLALSPDGRTLHYVQRGFVEGDLGTGEIVSIDTSTNDVVRVLPIDTTPADDLPDRMWLSVDGDTAFVTMIDNNQVTLNAIDMATGASTGGAFLGNRGPSTNTGLISTADGSTIFVTQGSVLAIDTATFTATPVTDPNGDLDDAYGLVIVDDTLYALIPDEAENDFVRVAMVDVATRTVVGSIPVVVTSTPTQTVSAIPDAFGRSLDGTQIYVGYSEKEPVGPSIVHIAIIEPATNTVVGEVEGTGNLDLGVAVDPYLGLPIPLKCTLLKRKAAGKSLLGKLKCHSKAKAAATPVNGACLATAEHKLAVAFDKYPGACPGESEAIDVLIDACADTLLADDPGTDKCAVKSAIALGKGGNGRLLCAAKNVPKPGTAAACNAKQDEKAAKTLTKAGACVAPATLGDLRACTAGIVDLLAVMQEP